MSRVRTFAIVLACASLLVPSGVIAQEVPPTLEGVEWRLTSHPDPDGGDPLPVPLGVTASLLLEGGQVSGHGGCNTFSGTYSLDGGSLAFSELASTLVACDDPQRSVEGAYLAVMPEVAGWLIVDEVLQLSDADGATLLTFEVPDVNLTSSELDGLVSTLEALRSGIGELQEALATLDEQIGATNEDVEAINVRRLRERIAALETESQRLSRRLAALGSQDDSSSTEFNTAQMVLLEAVPARIASTCRPRTGGLPDGAVAAVTCRPATSAVARLDYVLLEGPDATSHFTALMEDHNVPEATSARNTCARGRRSLRHWIGRGWQSEGCFRADGTAEVHFVDNATDCRQLRVSGQRLRNPALLVSLEGTGSDIARVHAWAMRGASDVSPQLTGITRPIARPSQPVSPSCPA